MTERESDLKTEQSQEPKPYGSALRYVNRMIKTYDEEASAYAERLDAGPGDLSIDSDGYRNRKATADFLRWVRDQIAYEENEAWIDDMSRKELGRPTQAAEQARLSELPAAYRTRSFGQR